MRGSSGLNVPLAPSLGAAVVLEGCDGTPAVLPRRDNNLPNILECRAGHNHASALGDLSRCPRRGWDVPWKGDRVMRQRRGEGISSPQGSPELVSPSSLIPGSVGSQKRSGPVAEWQDRRPDACWSPSEPHRWRRGRSDACRGHCRTSEGLTGGTPAHCASYEGVDH